MLSKVSDYTLLAFAAAYDERVNRLNGLGLGRMFLDRHFPTVVDTKVLMSDCFVSDFDHLRSEYVSDFALTKNLDEAVTAARARLHRLCPCPQCKSAEAA